MLGGTLRGAPDVSSGTLPDSPFGRRNAPSGPLLLKLPRVVSGCSSACVVVRSCRVWLAVWMVMGGLAGTVRAQRAPSPESPTYVDGEGVFRWSDTGAEVALFGVNYATPFAYGYRAHGALDVDRKQAIDRDVAHLARLGLDAFRVHVWDREVSTADGTLVENDHLDLLDYLLARLSERGIKTLLTPIAWWGAGYPEPDPGTDGFSDHYSKAEMSVDPEARRAQMRYLRQFVQHVNPYRGRSYAEDPDVIAFEVINEPTYGGGPDEITEWVNALVGAMREGGVTKPIFFNISEGYWDAQGQAVCAADVQGVSAQWYPTGLVRNRALGGNPLPNVDRYPLPFADFPACRDKARMVYEFDGADVRAPILYPAMARAFRGGGFQWATQFAYDALAVAYSNTDYQTHFLNLVYTPRKAVAFLIAGEVFRRTPRGTTYGTYPESATFGPFRVSFEDGLSEMVTDTAFYHAASTSTTPPDAAALRHVAGVRSSPVVAYEGTGAYFLDRLVDGAWRLEVYPDAVEVEDPYSRGSLDRAVVRLVWAERAMTIRLPDLGAVFSVAPRNDGNGHRPSVDGQTFAVRPGVYVVTRAGVDAAPYAADAAFRSGTIGDYYAPPATGGPLRLRHTPPTEAVAGRSFLLEATVVADVPVDSAAVLLRRHGDWRSTRRVRLEPTGPFTYAAEVDAPDATGLAEYVVTVYRNGEARTFPDDLEGTPFAWDYAGTAWWRVPLVAPDAPLVLFDAQENLDDLLIPTPFQYVPFQTGWVAGSEPGRLAVRAEVASFEPAPHHLALRSVLPETQRTRLDEVGDGATLHLTARATTGTAGPLDVALVLRDGSAWGTTVDLGEEWSEIEIPVAALRPVPLYLLPRPYPQFLPYRFEAPAPGATPDLADLDGLQVALDGAVSTAARGFEVERVTLSW